MFWVQFDVRSNYTIAPPKKRDTPLMDGSFVMGFKAAKVLIATIGLSLGSAALAEDLVYALTGKAGSVWYIDTVNSPLVF